eukprot:TRINITY_DN72335_c0_g1_i1.p1 TRINITY_DN72335_c0_g1~~TRINITY_DN72335_c0_g1_i1.p1  ORF type:complete len:330 (-),score=22.97 TRINITY_DN72335_c0_g1_i1:451-1440(-)
MRTFKIFEPCRRLPSTNGLYPSQAGRIHVATVSRGTSVSRHSAIFRVPWADFGSQDGLLEQRGSSICSSVLSPASAIDDVSLHTGFSASMGRRNTMLKNARQSAARADVDCDNELLESMVSGKLPESFDGHPYQAEPTQGQWMNMLLSINRKDLKLGYIRGNVRFMPAWLNALLNLFSYAETLDIVDRMCGTKARIACKPILSDHYQAAREAVKAKRRAARCRGVSVSACFTFDNLLKANMIVDRCPYSGMSLIWRARGVRGGLGNSASFDQIRPGAGYSIENVQVIANRVNMLKLNIPCEDLFHVSKALKYLQSDDYYQSHVPVCVRS